MYGRWMLNLWWIYGKPMVSPLIINGKTHGKSMEDICGKIMMGVPMVDLSLKIEKWWNGMNQPCSD